MIFVDNDPLRNYRNPRFKMGRPPKPDHLRRSEVLQVRLTRGELANLKEASRRLSEPMGDILREGAVLYIRNRGEKGGSSKRRKK
jgi:hypothetical protein